MIFKNKSIYAVALLSAAGLTGCLSRSGDLPSSTSSTSTTLSSFNLTDISASTDNVKTMTLTWTKAASGTGISYTVCQKDTSEENDCLALDTVEDTLTATVTVDSLVEALAQDYFILASNGSSTVSSNEDSLTTETANEMIGYFKADHVDEDDSYDNDISSTNAVNVALSQDGTTLAIAVPFDDSDYQGITTSSFNDNSDAAESGAVYVFKKVDNTWSRAAYIKASNAQSNDVFGYSIALSSDGGTLAVGAWGEDGDQAGVQTELPITDSDGTGNSGAVYIFDLSDSDSSNWVQSAYIKASNLGISDEFGLNLALSGDGSTLAVGAPFEDNDLSGIETSSDFTDDSVVTTSGAVYLFKLDGDNWTQDAYIKASNVGSGDEFGSNLSLSTDGSALAVGVPLEDGSESGIQTGTTLTDSENTSLTDSGAVYLFDLSDSDSSSWEQSAYIKASNGEDYDYFGKSVSLSGDGQILAVGASSESGGTTGIQTSTTIDEGSESSDSGAVYLFDLSDSDSSYWVQSAYIKASNLEDDDEFGFSVALSNDGSTLAVGAPYEDGGTAGIQTSTTIDEGTTSVTESGAVYLFDISAKSTSSWQQSAYIKASNLGDDAYFGRNLSISSDGSALAVDAPSEDGGETGIQIGTVDEGTTVTNSGAVYLY
ncbi:hypothetical protein [Vibrio eleionomae]|uniref:hypothetical protein n=1 Tax=Vibrio eleionomae TaxID=2653505 RepID=UPI0031F3FA49